MSPPPSARTGRPLSHSSQNTALSSSFCTLHWTLSD
uniref:Uncharacterized protein n=1 Tax=Anguilla anguilla TaxID=7936 RepID=A0A0E9XLT6_ANGAN